ncbi:hypothetical protein FPZ43_09640 [Mucilaginibacter pallidiroseus]|uniref:Carboxypeptidase-like regulatory domain-containing protein n=1 Tax=Mucilaginibacter pallidiroseus TaxID=2599295 RepID=A0A563UCZ0_9SPHI|nr:hypothetical protein [Mucilaginibacter pallidiroseus]TWR29225.1 hypothetical protein FPZ43_09640 [Mucilaginibacter pallidiroseus]
MSRIYTLILALLFVSSLAVAQQTLKGTVYENGTTIRINNVFVRDDNNKQVTITDKNGQFEIRTATGHLLIFNSPGYVPDTVYLIDMKPKKIMMVVKTINLNQVNVTATRTEFNPRVEYKQVYEKSKVYVFSPSTWFSRDAKNARRLKKYFQKDAEERHIDAVFTPVYVGSIVPLKGQELSNFISLYRPTYKFIRSNNSESMVAYINDSYKKYMALPPDKRQLPALAPAPDLQ